MPLNGLMRVKNESRWMERAVKSILPVCEKVWVLDNHSTDDTWRIASQLGCYVLESPFINLDEARDNTWLLDAAMSGIPPVSCGPLSCYWFLHMDGDEELVEQDRVKLGDNMLWGTPPNWSVQILYLWNDEGTVRVDGHYGKCYRPSIFRALRHGMTYKNMSGKIHSTGVPQEIGYTPRLHDPEPVRLLHYGYMENELREKKFDWYMGIDSVQEEFYRRECFGPRDNGVAFKYPESMTREQFTVEYSKEFDRTTGFLCRTRGLDHAAAEELSQSAWARAWEKRVQWRGNSKFVSWVISIAINLHLIQLRRKTVDQLDSEYDMPVCFVYEQLEMEMDAARVLRLCGQSHRKALESKYVDENQNLSNSDRTRVRRAVLAVRKSLSMAAGA